MPRKRLWLHLRQVSRKNLLKKRDGRVDLILVFQKQKDRTVVRSQHLGPLRVQRPFYPDSPKTPHVYILHPPGGVVSGDQLSINMDLEEDTCAVVTTPGATKIYRQLYDRASHVSQSIKVASNALMEWLPLETIVFDGAVIDMQTSVHLDFSAVFAGWEIMALGRPAAQAPFVHGRLCQTLELYRQGHPILHERLHVDPQRRPHIQKAAWGLDSYTVIGTLVITADCSQLVKEVLSYSRHQDYRIGASQLEGVAVFRYLGHSAQQAKDTLAEIWLKDRNRWGGSQASAPRIWRT